VPSLPSTLERSYLVAVSICFAVACVGLISGFWLLWNTVMPKDFSFTIFASPPLVSIGIGAAALLAGLATMRSWRQAQSAGIIPEPDRRIVESLLEKGSREGIEAYLDLSSLRGATVLFRRIGISGLPLATILLTLIFAGMSLLPSNPHSDKYLEIARVALGAFIGSFVQKQQTNGQTKSPAGDTSTTLPGDKAPAAQADTAAESKDKSATGKP
jgi:hypothetical protein